MLFDDWQFVADSVWPKDMVVATNCKFFRHNRPYCGRAKPAKRVAAFLCFMQVIFARDKPILENQVSETVAARSARRDHHLSRPIFDRFSALTDRYGVRYGVNPTPAH